LFKVTLHVFRIIPPTGFGDAGGGLHADGQPDDDELLAKANYRSNAARIRREIGLLRDQSATA
jgi:hypothetical protein